MKHQISRMTSTTDPDAIQELERIINIYDASLKTGNETLDVCLMEKKLLCEQNHIKFDCMINGQSLSFMQPADIFFTLRECAGGRNRSVVQNRGS